MNNRRDFQKMAWDEWLKDASHSQRDINPPSDYRSVSVGHGLKAVDLRQKLRTDNIISQPQQKRAFGSDRTFLHQESNYQPSRLIKHTKEDPRQKRTNEIAIELTLPKFKLPKLSRAGKKTIISVAGAALAIGLLIGVPSYLRQKTFVNGADTNSQSLSDKPPFAPLKPQDASSSGGAVADSRYDSKKQLFVYDREFRGAVVTISQQPVPTAFKQDASKLRTTAQSIGATESISTIYGEVYLSKNEEGTAQRLVFIRGQVLVFMQSSTPLSSTDWVEFIQSLQ